MLEDIGIQLLFKLLPVIAALLIALLSLGIGYIRKYIKKIDNETFRKSLNNAIIEAQTVAKNTVMSVQQTFVNDLKEKRKDGKLSKQEAIQALEKAKNIFIKNLSKDTIQVIESSIGPIQNYARNLLEAKLKEMKDENDIKGQIEKLANPELPELNMEKLLQEQSEKEKDSE